MVFIKSAKRGLACFIATGLLSGVASASEISFLQGLYRQSDVKKGMSKSEISAGARYSQQFAANMFWFAEGGMNFKTYSGGGELTPKNSNDMSIKGGARYYFDRLGEKVAPFATMHLMWQNDTDAVQFSDTRVEEVKKQGLYYGSTVGLRMSMSDQFFLDVETPLFASALRAKERITVSAEMNGTVVDDTSEVQKSELFVQGDGALSSIVISVGMRI